MSSSVQSPPAKSTVRVTAELPRYTHYIDGACVAPTSNQYLETENPYTGKAWALIARGTQPTQLPRWRPPTAPSTTVTGRS